MAFVTRTGAAVVATRARSPAGQRPEAFRPRLRPRSTMTGRGAGVEGEDADEPLTGGVVYGGPLSERLRKKDRSIVASLPARLIDGSLAICRGAPPPCTPRGGAFGRGDVVEVDALSGQTRHADGGPLSAVDDRGTDASAALGRSAFHPPFLLSSSCRHSANRSTWRRKDDAVVAPRARSPAERARVVEAALPLMPAQVDSNSANGARTGKWLGRGSG